MLRRTIWLALASGSLVACTGSVGPGPSIGRSSGSQRLRVADGGTEDGYSVCAPIENCSNGGDDNCDGLIDCDDPSCLTDEFCGTQCIPEVCDNGVDDDCDGQSDCADPNCTGAASCHTECVEIAQDCEWAGCNRFDGSDEAACLAAGNDGGCPDYVFTEWCRRRTPGGHWDEIHREWVASRCTGAITLDGNTFTCREDSTCTTYTCTTPLVLVLDGVSPVTFSADDGGSAFDLSSAGDGTAMRTDWPTSATPWLVLDRDGDGRIDSGRELFGSATLVAGVPARDGFEALTALDANHDGVLDAQDPAFGELAAWADTDGDRVSQPSELRSVTALGIESLSVSYAVTPRCDARGNCERERGSVTWHDAAGAAHTGAVVDVHLRVRD